MKSMFLLRVFAVMAIAGFGQILMGKCVSLIKGGQTFGSFLSDMERHISSMPEWLKEPLTSFPELPMGATPSCSTISPSSSGTWSFSAWSSSPIARPSGHASRPWLSRQRLPAMSSLFLESILYGKTISLSGEKRKARVVRAWLGSLSGI